MGFVCAISFTISPLTIERYPHFTALAGSLRELDKKHGPGWNMGTEGCKRSKEIGSVVSMSWTIPHKIADILNKGSDNAGIDREGALNLMRLELHARETYALMETANRLSREQFNGKGENHFI